MKKQPYNYSLCRAINHAWVPSVTVHKSSVGVTITLDCIHCGSQRVDVMNRRGTLNGRRYVKPDDYKSDKRTKEEWRELFIKEAREAKPIRRKKTA